MWNLLKKFIALKLAAKATEKAGRWTREKRRKKGKARRRSGGMLRGRAKKPAGNRTARIAGGALGGVASFLAIYAIRSLRSRRSETQSYAQSGQAPSRSHIRLTSHSAVQAR